METRMSGHDVALDPTPGDEDSVTPIAYLTDTEDEPAQILERAETSANRSAGLRSALAKLDDRSRRIIEARWLREDDDRRRCRSWPTNTACPPSASARSRARR